MRFSVEEFLGQAVGRCFWEPKEKWCEKHGQRCPRDIPFPGIKARTEEGRWPISYGYKQEGDVFTSRKAWSSPSSFSSLVYTVVVKSLPWGFLEESLAVGLSQGFWKPRVQFLLLVSFWRRTFSESVSPWQVQRYFRVTVWLSPSRSDCSSEPTQSNYGGNWV